MTEEKFETPKILSDFPLIQAETEKELRADAVRACPEPVEGLDRVF